MHVVRCNQGPIGPWAFRPIGLWAVHPNGCGAFTRLSLTTFAWVCNLQKWSLEQSSQQRPAAATSSRYYERKHVEISEGKKGKTGMMHIGISLVLGRKRIRG